MAQLITARRTGTLIVGVVPPSGVPLPQYTNGFGYWVGSPGELMEPAVRATLLTLTKLRRELRLGRLRQAAALAVDVHTDQVPLGVEAARSIAVLAAADAAWPSTPGIAAAVQLAARLAQVADPIPATLLDVLLDPAATIGPELVEAALAHRQLSPGLRARLSLLLLRRAALDHQHAPSPEALGELERRAAAVSKAPMHPKLKEWAAAVLAGAGKKDLHPLIRALGPNLPLADPTTHRLFDAVSAYFERPNLDREAQRQLSRATFGAWSTLQAIEGAYEIPALVSFAGLAAQLRSIAELLLDRSLRRALARERPALAAEGALGVSSQGAAPLELSAWYGLLFAGVRADHHELDELRAWFAGSERLAPLREDDALRLGLAALLSARLDTLPLDESNAAQSMLDLWETFRTVGFGSTSSSRVPTRGAGLFGLLLRVID